MLERNSNLINRQSAGPLVRIHILGPMSAMSYSGESVLPRGKRARAILGSLCLADGAPLKRGRLAALLWDRVPDSQARASFRQALRELMVAFGPLTEDLILADRETIRLDTDQCWVDAIALLENPSELLAGDIAKQFEKEIDVTKVFGGELLDDLDDISTSFDQWLIGERTRFTEERRDLFEKQLTTADEANDADQRASIARRLIKFDPTHEGALRILMRALVDMKDPAQALREYAKCRDALKKTLDIEPSAETQSLHDMIRQGSIARPRAPATDAVPIVVPAKRKRSKVPTPVADPSRRRVGVLPFMASDDASEERLALWLSLDISTALSRFRWFDVVAPVALMRSPHALMNDDILRRNELDYVVDGALSHNGDRVQINVRLLNLKHYAKPVWSERFDLASDRSQGVHDDVIAKIVARIDPVILFIEGKAKRRDKTDATGLLAEALPLIYRMERAQYEEAGALIQQALQVEPDNAMVAAWAAHWHLFYVGQGWARIENVPQELAAAREHARNATVLDPDNAEALGIYAHILAFAERDFDSALHYFDRALRLNPNLAFNWAFSSGTYSYIGEPDIALQRLERYRELAPFDPYYFWFENFYTIAYVFKGDYRQAAIVGRRAVKANPGFSNAYKPLIAALGHLGQIEEAREAVGKLLLLEPNFTVQRFAKTYPIKKDSDRERYMDGLRKAGVPEG